MGFRSAAHSTHRDNNLPKTGRSFVASPAAGFWVSFYFRDRLACDLSRPAQVMIQLHLFLLACYTLHLAV